MQMRIFASTSFSNSSHQITHSAQAQDWGNILWFHSSVCYMLLHQGVIISKFSPSESTKIKMWVPKFHTSQISASKQQTRPIWVRSKLMWGLPWILGWPLLASLMTAWPQCSGFKISRSEIAFGCHQSGLLAKTCMAVLSAVWLNRYMLDCFFFPLSCQVLLPIVISSQISLIFC